MTVRHIPLLKPGHRSGSPALALHADGHGSSADRASPLAWWHRAGSATSPRIAGGVPRLALAFLVGAATAGGVLALAERDALARASHATELAESGTSARLVALEQRLQALEAMLATRGPDIDRALSQAEAAARQAETAATAIRRPDDGFVAALLNLQMAVATSRPWNRELRAALELDAARHVAPPVLEVLSSHSLRGVPTEAELRERFLAMAPSIAWRMPNEGGVLDRTSWRVRATLSDLGLVAPPAPNPADAVVSSILERIRRGDLAGAVADASTLDKRAEPLLAGWSAQARARLAVEQAVRETILTALSRPARP